MDAFLQFLLGEFAVGGMTFQYWMQSFCLFSFFGLPSAWLQKIDNVGF
jgi:hypothetical protein